MSDNEDRVLMAFDDYDKLEKRLETPSDFVCVTGVEQNKVALVMFLVMNRARLVNVFLAPPLRSVKIPLENISWSF